MDSCVGKTHWRRHRLPTPVFLGFPGGLAGKESTCNAEDLVLIPGLGRSPGERKGYPLQYSGLENPMDFTVHGVAESDMPEQFSLMPPFPSLDINPASCCSHPPMLGHLSFQRLQCSLPSKINSVVFHVLIQISPSPDPLSILLCCLASLIILASFYLSYCLTLICLDNSFYYFSLPFEYKLFGDILSAWP